MRTLNKTQNKTLHNKNLHNQRYDFEELIKSSPHLKQYVKLNKYGDLSIDFSNANAVLALNKALLKHFYQIDWSIPKNYLCPPIPGRVDYIHYLADLLPTDKKDIKGIDIGMGANCIYPLVGNKVYGWKFIGTDIDNTSIQNAKNIVEENDLTNDIQIIQQTSKESIFHNIISKNDKFDFTMCNPPFHKSKKEAKEGSKRKITNLSKGKNRKVSLNFGGQANELWCEGGEVAFILKMINESLEYKENVTWFTTLVSKKENLNTIYNELEKVGVKQTKTIQMQQGQKLTRFVAWSFSEII